MSLQFVVGSAGSGKSTYLYEHMIKEAMANPKENYFIIVPEQFTMATQQKLVAMHPHHVIMNIDVLSFDRLAYRIFDELGTDTYQVLEETGKNLLLRKVAQEEEDKLEALGKNMKRPGYISQVKSLISEMMQYDISPEDLLAMMEHPAMGEAFAHKAKDLYVMYEGFCQKIEQQYITTEEILQKLKEVVADSNLLSGSVMVFDGFTGFTPVQHQLIEELLKLTECMIFTVTCHPSESLFGEVKEQELFAMSKQMVAKLRHLAQRSHTPIEEVIYLRDSKRFLANGMLSHLEENLFQPHAKAFVENEGKGIGEIEIASLSNPRQELQFVVSEIEKKVRNEGMRYRDFAVVCANMESYAYLVPGIFSKLHIPYFLDVRSEIAFHPFVETINSLFFIIEENFSYESVMRHLRAGMSPLSIEEIDRLENYLLAARIRGKNKYSNMFQVIPQNYSPEDLVELNVLREKFFEPIGKFMSYFPKKKGKVEEIAEQLYALFVDYGMEEQLWLRAKKYEEENDEVLANTNEQIYGHVIDLLDKMVAILGDEEMSLVEFGELLSAGFEAIGVGNIPPGNDQVLVGDMERSRLEEIKVLYLIGANDGAIPKSLGHGGIISQIDRENMKTAQYEVAPTDRERSFMQRFYLYLMMTKPSQGLVVTYSRVDMNGKTLRKSYLIHTLQKLFPQMKEYFLEQLPVENRLLTEESARGLFLEELRQYVETGSVGQELSLLLAKYFSQQSEDAKTGKRGIPLLDAAFFEHKEEKISKAVLDAVFGQEIKESVSRLEAYARCAYAFYLKYGMGLNPRAEHTFASVDMGNLYHTALELYAKELDSRDDVTWHNIDETVSDEILQEAILKTYQTMTKAAMLEDARDLYVLHGMEKTLKQTVWALQQQIRKGDFVPSRFEVDFSQVDDLDAMTYQIDQMHKLKLRGKVDRVDLYERDDTIYVKIVDYKSGNKELDYNLLYHGLQVQLVLYMSAMRDSLQETHKDKKIEPGAMFYYHIHRPLIEAKSKEVDVEAGILKELQMKGVVNADDKVVQALHRNLQGTSDVIPVGIKQDGTYTAASHLLSRAEFDLMEEYAKMQMEQTGKRIVEGEFDCKPYKKGDATGCDYCEFHGVCGFDLALDGYAYRKLSEEKDKTILFEKMQQELAIYKGKNQGEEES